jgi:dynein heavy chain
MGRIFGPPTGKTLMFFMDDLNMPKLDKYGTQSPICLIR